MSTANAAIIDASDEADMPQPPLRFFDLQTPGAGPVENGDNPTEADARHPTQKFYTVR